MTTIDTASTAYWWVATTKTAEASREEPAETLKADEKTCELIRQDKSVTIRPDQLADRIDSFRYRVDYLKHMEFYKLRWISQARSENMQGAALLDGHFLVNRYFNNENLIFSISELPCRIEVLNQLKGTKVCISSELPHLIRNNNYFGNGTEGVPQLLAETLGVQAGVDYAPKIKPMDSWTRSFKEVNQTFEEAQAMAEQHCISKTSIHETITAYELPYGGSRSQAKFLNQSLTKGELQAKEYLGDSPTADQLQAVMDELIADLQEPFFDDPPKARNKEEAKAILAQPCWGEKEKSKRFLHLFVPGGKRNEPDNTAPLMIAGAELEQLNWKDEEDSIHLYKRTPISRICLEKDDHIVPKIPNHPFPVKV